MGVESLAPIHKRGTSIGDGRACFFLLNYNDQLPTDSSVTDRTHRMRSIVMRAGDSGRGSARSVAVRRATSARLRRSAATCAAPGPATAPPLACGLAFEAFDRRPGAAF